MTMITSRRSSCLYTTVRNTAGVTKKFGFLPPHGRELAAGEEFTLAGSLVSAISRGEPVTDRRHYQAAEAALNNGDLEVIETPCVVLYDETLDNSKVLNLNNGSTAYVSPTWDPDSASVDGDGW